MGELAHSCDVAIPTKESWGFNWSKILRERIESAIPYLAFHVEEIFCTMKEIIMEEGLEKWEKVPLLDLLEFLSNSNHAYPFARLSIDNTWKEKIAFRVSFEISNTSMQQNLKKNINPDDGLSFPYSKSKDETSSEVAEKTLNYMSNEPDCDDSVDGVFECSYSNPYTPSEDNYWPKYPTDCENSSYSPI